MQKTSEMTLEDAIKWLGLMGEPRLAKFDTGWHCYVFANVSQSNPRVEFRSDYGVDTPTVAARQCVDRVVEAIENLSLLARVAESLIDARPSINLSTPGALDKPVKELET